MNERIEELIHEANRYVVEKNEYPIEEGEMQPIKDHIVGVRQHAAKRKLAELIVKECIKESMDEIVSDDEIAQEKDPLVKEYLKGNNQGIVDAVVRFRNHFGVEE